MGAELTGNAQLCSTHGGSETECLKLRSGRVLGEMEIDGCHNVRFPIPIVCSIILVCAHLATNMWLE